MPGFSSEASLHPLSLFGRQSLWDRPHLEGKRRSPSSRAERLYKLLGMLNERWAYGRIDSRTYMFMLWALILYCFPFPVAQMVLPWPLGALCPFDMPCHCRGFVFEHFPTFWHNKMLQAHFVYFLPQRWNQPSLQGTLIPCIGESHVNFHNGSLFCFIFFMS